MTDTPPREFNGRDLVEALQQASRAFGVKRSQIGYELLEEGRKGILGIGSRECIIRAWPRAGAPTRNERSRSDRPPRGERGRGDRPRGDRGRGGRGDRQRGERSRDDRPRGGASARGGERSHGEGDDGARRRGRRGSTGGGGAARRGDDLRAPRGRQGRRGPGTAEDGELPHRLADRPRDQRDDRRGGRGRRHGGSAEGQRRGGGGQARHSGGSPTRQGGGRARRDDEGPRDERPRRRGRRQRPGQRAAPPAASTPQVKEETVPASDAHAAEVQDLLEEIITHWGLELGVSAEPKDDTVHVELEGNDVELLTEEEGEVLDALQYVVSKMVSRQVEDNIRVLLEAGGSRHDRDERLRRLAQELAEEATESGKKVRTEPLSAYERRVIHLTLAELGGIRTFSVGRGYRKRVTVVPEGADDEAQEADDRPASRPVPDDIEAELQESSLDDDVASDADSATAEEDASPDDESLDEAADFGSDDDSDDDFASSDDDDFDDESPDDESPDDDE